MNKRYVVFFQYVAQILEIKMKNDSNYDLSNNCNKENLIECEFGSFYF